MKRFLSRRSFLQGSTLGVGVFAVAPFNILSAESKGEKVRVVQVGCGGRGMAHMAATPNEHVAAIVDVDEKRHVTVLKWLEGKGIDAGKVQVFTDYRRMFDKMGKDFDAVFIATPNHQHA